jgi:mRNA interferase HigB
MDCAENTDFAICEVRGTLSAEKILHVISRKKLIEASRKHAEVSAPLDTWYRVAKSAEWKNLMDVRKTFFTADAVGSCTVFNMKGNSYRLIVWINYQSQKVFIKHVLTHAEYSKEVWKSDCFPN